MPRPCIICGKRAGSREHIFPAALGGRRVNKGIYCGGCNEGFSGLVAELSSQLHAINALIGIRQGHSDRPIEYAVTSPVDGREYLISGGTTRLKGVHITNDETLDSTRYVTARFADQHQADQWISEQRKHGQVLERKTGGWTQAYFLSPINIRLSLGGTSCLRSIGYIAMTFLAHRFPKIARDVSLTNFKSFVLGESGSDQLVWWERQQIDSDFGPKKFRFGHRILIGMSAVNQAVYARVSLFSALDLAMIFGHPEISKDETVLFEVDPQADQPPADIIEMTANAALSLVHRPDSLTADLGDSIQSGRARSNLSKLFGEIDIWRMESVVTEVYEKICALDRSTSRILFDDVDEILTNPSYGQLILKVIIRIWERLREHLHTNPDTKEVSQFVPPLVVADPNSLSGLGRRTEMILSLCRREISSHITQEIVTEKLTKDGLSQLLAGAAGTAIIAHKLWSLLFMSEGGRSD